MSNLELDGRGTAFREWLQAGAAMAIILGLLATGVYAMIESKISRDYVSKEEYATAFKSLHEDINKLTEKQDRFLEALTLYHADAIKALDRTERLEKK